MANTLTYLGYSKATGRTPFLRFFSVSFSGSYVQNNSEVINFASALNPNGIEDFQVPTAAVPTLPALVLGSTLNGYTPELEIGGTGTAGQYGITFWSGSTQAAAGVYSGLFPANGSNYGQVILGIADSLG